MICPWLQTVLVQSDFHRQETPPGCSKSFQYEVQIFAPCHPVARSDCTNPRWKLILLEYRSIDFTHLQTIDTYRYIYINYTSVIKPLSRILDDYICYTCIYIYMLIYRCIYILFPHCQDLASEAVHSFRGGRRRSVSTEPWQRPTAPGSFDIFDIPMVKSLKSWRSLKINGNLL